jgi:hypothetical protein
MENGCSGRLESAYEDSAATERDGAEGGDDEDIDVDSAGYSSGNAVAADPLPDANSRETASHPSLASERPANLFPVGHQTAAASKDLCRPPSGVLPPLTDGDVLVTKQAAKVQSPQPPPLLTAVNMQLEVGLSGGCSSGVVLSRVDLPLLNKTTSDTDDPMPGPSNSAADFDLEVIAP